MSIDTTIPDGGFDPSPFECLTCWPGDDTSRTLFMCLQGIEKGTMWAPGDPAPPNDSFALEVTAQCTWETEIAGFEFLYQIFGGFSLMRVKLPLGEVAFFGPTSFVCSIWNANTFQFPGGRKYFGGWCTVIPPAPNGPFSIPELLALIDVNPSWAKWLQPRPMVNNQVVYGLYGGPTHSNVRIKIDHT